MVARKLLRSRREFEASGLPKIERANNALDPLDWYCLDGHVLNILCRVPDARRGWRAGRPTLTGVLDLSTRIMVGWDLRGTENSDGILAGLKRALRDYGVPRHLYVDNGSSYKAAVGKRATKFVVRARDPRIGGLCAQTGTTLHHALVDQGWSKMIESWWRITINEFERYWRQAYFGNIGARPDDAGQLRVDQLPTVDDVAAAYAQFLPAFHATERDCLGGLTPLLKLEQFPHEVRRLDPDVLDFLCCRLAGPRTVSADGISWQNVRYGHFDEHVWKLQGKKVWLRLDPDQAGYVWLCDESGAPLCRASNRKLTGATPEEVREAARIRARMRKIAREYAPARDFLLDTNIQQVLRVRRQQAESRQAAARAKLPPCSLDSKLTLLRTDLVPAVQAANATAEAQRIAEGRKAKTAGQTAAERIAAAGITPAAAPRRGFDYSRFGEIEPVLDDGLPGDPWSRFAEAAG